MCSLDGRDMGLGEGRRRGGGRREEEVGEGERLREVESQRWEERLRKVGGMSRETRNG